MRRFVCVLSILAACGGSGGDGGESEGSESGTSTSGSPSETGETGETGEPADPCAALQLPGTEIPNLLKASLVEQTIWMTSTHSDGAPSGVNWTMRLDIAGHAIEPSTFDAPAAKAECWWGDTDGACDLTCDDTVTVEIVEVTDTCFSIDVAQASEELVCDGLTNSGPFLDIVDVQGAALVSR